jgi:4-alpha-glucanotransferase
MTTPARPDASGTSTGGAPAAEPDPKLASLYQLAERVGVLVQWQDAQGRDRTLDPDLLRTVLETLDLPCATMGQCEASRAQLAGDDADRTLPPLITADQGRPVLVPLADTRPQLPYRLELEDGSVQTGMARRGASGVDFTVPAVASHGYHRLLLGDSQVTLAIAPERCFGVEDALRAQGLDAAEIAARRPWGISTQVYGLRRGVATGAGDFTALAECAAAAAHEGADALAINPMHAGFAALPERYSPYAPSSRVYFNPIYIDPAAVFGQAAVDRGISTLGLGNALHALEARSEIDWVALSRARYGLLRWLWDHRDKLMPAPARDALAAFRTRGGDALLAHAAFEALQAHHIANAASQAEADAATDWRQWPVRHRSPADAAVTAFVSANRDEIDYHIFLQWLADDGLAQAQRTARESGMAIGLIADLAVGTDPGGSHAWTRQDQILAGFSAGAPPDLYNPLGQNWGISVFSPRALHRHGYAGFLEMMRANLAHAGGLRIDHALGLARMWLVPDGAPPDGGAYLRYPMDDLLRLISLESWRHQAIIIGENLGTVPETFNATLYKRGVLGIDVLWFEREEVEKPAQPEASPAAQAPKPKDAPAAQGQPSGKDVPPSSPSPDKGAESAAQPQAAPFKLPERWATEAIATTTTHDLPTIAGWWAGRDIEWRARLGQMGPGETEAGALASRAAEREALWSALCDAGLASGAQPGPDDAPIEAVLTWTARAPTPLRMIPIEDLLGEVEQPNLPGTTTEHPNWRRRLGADVRTLFSRPTVRKHVDALRTATPVAASAAAKPDRGASRQPDDGRTGIQTTDDTKGGAERNGKEASKGKDSGKSP